jgi:hypothetical protein
MCRRRWRTSSWFMHGRTSNTNHLCKPFLNHFWWTAPFTSTAQHDSAYIVALTLLWLSIPLFSCSRLPFGGKKKVASDPFSYLAQDRNEGPEDYRISWALWWPASCDLFWTGMSQTQFWPSLKFVGEGYMRNLPGFNNLWLILVFWIFLWTGMSFFFF